MTGSETLRDMPPHVPLIILKIGGAVLTQRNVDRPLLNRQHLRRIAREVAAAYHPARFRLVLIHGAGSFGHPIVLKTGIQNGLHTATHLVAFAETQRLQNYLNSLVVRALVAKGIPAFPLQPSASAVTANGSLEHLDLDVLKGLLQWGCVPVLYGVPAYDRLRGCSILSGDRIATFVGVRLGAVSILHGTNVAGVYTDDPYKNPRATFIERIDAHNIGLLDYWLKHSSSPDVTGGMYTKVKELCAAGIPAQVFDARVPRNVTRALQGMVVGTIIQP